MPTLNLALLMTEPIKQDSQQPVSHEPSSDEKLSKDQTDSRHQWQRGFASAWMVLGAAPAGCLIGYFIDKAYDSTPLWMIILSFLFLAVSLYQLIKDSNK